MEMDSRYHVGDRVVVNNVKHCVFGWNEFMEKFHGCLVTIRSVSWNNSKKVYRYGLKEDDDDWAWDDSCFVSEIPDLPDFAVDTAGLSSLFS